LPTFLTSFHHKISLIDWAAKAAFKTCIISCYGDMMTHTRYVGLKFELAHIFVEAKTKLYTAILSWVRDVIVLTVILFNC
jgi:hypothetical protein